jgi:hypothetical protein
VRATLGDALWADFVAHANACYTDAFLSAVPKPVLRCVGPPHGVEGLHKFSGNLTCARAYLYATLGELHLDHEQDLVVTCDMWVQALAALATWDDGVDGAFLVNFSVPDDPADGAAMGRCCTIPTTADHDLSLTRAAAR